MLGKILFFLNMTIAALDTLNECMFLFVCFSQTPEELEDDSDFEQEDYDTRSRTSVQTEDDQLIAGQSARVSGCFYSHAVGHRFTQAIQGKPARVWCTHTFVNVRFFCQVKDPAVTKHHCRQRSRWYLFPDVQPHLIFKRRKEKIKKKMPDPFAAELLQKYGA